MASERIRILQLNFTQNASSGTYKQLGDKVRSNPSSIMMSASDIYVKMETMKFAYPGVSIQSKIFLQDQIYFQSAKKSTSVKEFLFLLYTQLEPLCYTLVASDFRKTGDCRFQVSDPLIFSYHGAIGLRKGGKNNEIFSYR